MVDQDTIMRRQALSSMIDEEIRDFPFDQVRGKALLTGGKIFKAEEHPVLLKLWEMVKDTDETIKCHDREIPINISRSFPDLLDEFNNLPEESDDIEILVLRSLIFKKKVLIYLDLKAEDWGKIKVT